MSEQEREADDIGQWIWESMQGLPRDVPDAVVLNLFRCRSGAAWRWRDQSEEVREFYRGIARGIVDTEGLTP